MLNVTLMYADFFSLGLPDVIKYGRKSRKERLLVLPIESRVNGFHSILFLLHIFLLLGGFQVPDFVVLMQTR